MTKGELLVQAASEVSSGGAGVHNLSNRNNYICYQQNSNHHGAAGQVSPLYQNSLHTKCFLTFSHFAMILGKQHI